MEYVSLEEIDSTQRYAKERLSSFSKETITCITTEYQLAGKGPRKTPWMCPKGKGILATYVVWQESAPQLAQVVSIAIAKVCIDLGLAPQLKWPNDVLLSSKKLAGCMVETYNSALLIGIGLNLLQSEEELLEIDQPATSLSVEYGKPLDKTYVLEQLSLHLENVLVHFAKEGFAPFYDQYLSLMKVAPEDPIIARVNDTKMAVSFLRFEKDGRLLVLLPHGEKRLLG